MGIVAAAAAVPDFDYSQWIESEVAERVRSERHAGLLFRARLLSTLRAEPVENGVGHHAEELLKSAFMTAPEPTAMRTQSLFTELLGNPAVAAGLITCVGRLRFELVRDVAGSLVVGGLAQANVEIREAAIGAIEQWGGKHFVPILEKHIEPETWLATYVDKVLRDLTTS
jgi:predicted HAD superfamily Cof-like phosphohydrolase